MTLDRRFLDCTFRRQLDWREEEAGKVIVLRPKFGTGKWGRWIGSRLGQSDYRIRLDEIGSLVWKACDGDTPAREIVQKLRAEFGSRVEPAEQRLHQFLMQMHRARMIELGEPAPASPGEEPA